MQDILPQVGDLVTVVVHRVFDALVERKEARLASRQAGRHGDLFVAHGKVNQAALESEQRLFGVSFRAILFLGVGHHLTGEAVLEFHRHQRQTVEEQCHVQRFFVSLRILELSNQGESVHRVEALMVGVHAAGRTEVGQVEVTAVVFHAFSQHIKNPAALNLRPNPIEEFFRCLPSVLVFQFPIFFRLRVPNKAQQFLGNQAAVFVIVGRG